MPTPSVDIIVPVWNSPFETRACLAAILEHSPGARLIIVDNGSSRETGLMLEEFSESLGDRALFISSDRNVGLVPAINIALSRSDSDYAVIVRPHVMVSAGWLEALLAAALTPRAGIVSPLFHGPGAPGMPAMTRGCTLIETFYVSFSTLLIRGDLHMLLGRFTEGMDSGEWCLKEYVRRALARGYHTLATAKISLACGQETAFGSEQRRRETTAESKRLFQAQWGHQHEYAVYFDVESTPEVLEGALEVILAGARRGHRFTLLMHRSQAAECKRRGWNGLHTGIIVDQLPLLMPRRALTRRIAEIRTTAPESILVRGSEGYGFPGIDGVPALTDLAPAFTTGIPAELTPELEACTDDFRNSFTAG